MKPLLMFSVCSILGFTAADIVVTYKTDNAQSSLKIEGTSTLHDWEVLAGDLKGSMEVDRYKDSIHIKKLSLSLPVKSLKSGKGGMDRNMYKALKAEEFDRIHYRFTGLEKWSETQENTLTLITEGQLTVAGCTQTLSIPITAHLSEEGIALSGYTSFAMSSFGVEPPTFMFGSLSTGDEITIKFNINFN